MGSVRPCKININGTFSFGEILKHLREEKNLSQLDLANAFGTTAQSIGRYEQNKREPNFELLLKMCNFFDVSTDFLLGKSKVRNAPLKDAANLLASYDSEYLEKALGKYSSEYKEPILALITDLSLAFADLDYPINVDKLFILSSINKAIDELLFSFKTPLNKNMSDENIYQLIDDCFSKQSFIQDICSMFFKRLLTSKEIDDFIFKKFLTNENDYDNTCNN